MKEATERELKRELLLSGFDEAAENSSFLMNQGDPNLILERLRFLRENGKLHPMTLED